MGMVGIDVMRNRDLRACLRPVPSTASLAWMGVKEGDDKMGKPSRPKFLGLGGRRPMSQ